MPKAQRVGNAPQSPPPPADSAGIHPENMAEPATAHDPEETAPASSPPSAPPSVAPGNPNAGPAVGSEGQQQHLEEDVKPVREAEPERHNQQQQPTPARNRSPDPSAPTTRPDPGARSPRPDPSAPTPRPDPSAPTPRPDPSAPTPAGRAPCGGPGGVSVQPDDAGYGPGAAVDLHTGSIVFTDNKDALSSDTYQCLLEDDVTPTSSRGFRCPRLSHTPLCVAKCYSLTLGVALVTLMVTVVMTVSCVPRVTGYRYSRPFLGANCSTSEATYEGRWEPCECSHRKSSFPCVQVYVTLERPPDSSPDGDRDRRDGNSTSSMSSASPMSSPASSAVRHLLRSNEYDLLADVQCSYVPKCSCDKDVNRQHVVVFIRTFNHPETSFSCFYNPARHSEIIRDREADVTSHWAKMLLPGVAFLLCILIMLLVWLLRKRNIWVVLKTETADKT